MDREENAVTEIPIKCNPAELSEQEAAHVVMRLGTTENGLTQEESEKRLSVYGKNSIKRKRIFHPLRNFAGKLVNLLALMLWAASFLALISGTPILSYAIWAIIFINAICSFIQENRADKALQSLAQLVPNNVKVLRDGDVAIQPAELLVPGDVIQLAAGDKVPADCRILFSNGLEVDNSMLTGESVPLERDSEPEREKGIGAWNSRNLLFAGTTVTSGTGGAVVYATGRQTELGAITETTSKIKKEKSTLEIQIQRITKILSVIAILIGIAAFCVSLFITEFEINAALIFAIGIIVANIPEGLMPTVSLSLALSVQRMAKKNALVRKQSAVETLSSTSVICTDKTGTLTQNSMFMKHAWTMDGMVDIGGQGYGRKGEVEGITPQNLPTLERFFTAAAVCSDTVIRTDERNENEWEVIGNPTEASLLIAGDKLGVETEPARNQFRRSRVFPFSSETKSMTVIAINESNPLFPENHVLNFTKGDPRKVISECTHIFKEGSSVVMDSQQRTEVLDVNDKMAQQGFRILAVAYSEATAGGDPSPAGLTLLGLAIMYDPPKEGVFEAVQECRSAGIKVTVVTGDYGVTALAIAKQVGIVDRGYVEVTGPELKEMDKWELARKIDTDLPIIFTRTTPEDKLKIVEAYQSLGHVVAVTGDGINDVLALRKADIGISMGKKGSDAAIESSDMVLLDDHFATIVEAVKEGRAIYRNIKKFITYILASNVPEVIPFLVMGIWNLPLALTVLLVLAIDLGTDLLPAISLGREEPEKDILDYPPRKKESNILDRRVLLRSYGFLGVLEALFMFAAFFFTWNSFGYTFDEIRFFTPMIADGTAPAEVLHVYNYAVTMAFGAVIACQIGNVLECRSSRLPFHQFLTKRNALMVWGIVSEIVLFLLIAYVPFLQELFETAGPEWRHIALLPVLTVLFILCEEIRKGVVRRTLPKTAL